MAPIDEERAAGKAKPGFERVNIINVNSTDIKTLRGPGGEWTDLLKSIGRPSSGVFTYTARGQTYYVYD
jgi:hypothetical protein